MVAFVIAFSTLGARAQTLDSGVYSRVFLQNGRALASYGESTLVGDRVVFVLPIGDPRGRVELQLISLPASAVDVTRTARYAEGARARSYAFTRGASDYSALMADVGLTLAEIDAEADRARRLETATDLRARLVEWPAAHYNYRAADLGKVLENLEQLLNEIQRDLGQTPSVRPPLRLAPSYDAPMPSPTAQELFTMAVAAADATTDVAARDAIQRIVRSMRPPAPPPAAPAVQVAVAPAPAAPAKTVAPVPTGTTGTTGTNGYAERTDARQPVTDAPVKSHSLSPVVPVVPDVSDVPNSGLTVADAPALLAGLAVLLVAGAAGLLWRKRRKTDTSGTTGTNGYTERTDARQLEKDGPAKPHSSHPIAPVVPDVPDGPVVPDVPLCAAPLEVGDVRDRREFGYQFVEGVVRNVSDRTLHFVEVIVDWCAPSGELFARESALIGLDALAPGSTSPFKVLTRANPSMASYSLMFQSEGATLAQFRQPDLQ